MNRPPAVTDHASALDWLMRQINYERTTAVPYQTAAFKLDRMRRLLALLGDPHLGLRAVHIAGTKGKGSTAAMLAAVLQAAGLKTGLYTSPHLSAIEERIAIDGRRCTSDDFTALAAELELAVGRLPSEASNPDASEPTFFEITTAMAFLHFAREKVDAAVLEVGLGGRLDSTNVCSPQVCIITSISFDHTRQLGNTLAAIAGEKAGIIKAGVPAISGVTAAEPRDVIQGVATTVGAPLVQAGEDYTFSSGELSGSNQALPALVSYAERVAGVPWRMDNVELGMLGRHQAANAAAAIAATRRLAEQGWCIDEGALRQGLAQARCPARIEVLCRRPTIILDVAHNVASVAALLAVLREQFAPRRRVLIFASSKDKDTAGMLRLLAPEFDEILLTRYIHNPRAVEPEKLLEMARVAMAETATSASRAAVLHRFSTPEEAWAKGCSVADDRDLLCITGSFFLAAELRPLVLATTLGASGNERSVR
jgi:dihydrofolate synthase / folylpolyglutamate synthase